jgi:tripartite-type tricarboxylate transporter receptor subunit TctC
LVRGGQLKGLGMAGLKRSPLAPDIPTVAETVPGFEGVTWFGLFGPAGVATDIVARLNREIAVVLQSEDTIRRYAALGVEPAASSPEELTAFMKKDMAKWADVIDRAGIKLP